MLTSHHRDDFFCLVTMLGTNTLPDPPEEEVDDHLSHDVNQLHDIIRNTLALSSSLRFSLTMSAIHSL